MKLHSPAFRQYLQQTDASLKTGAALPAKRRGVSKTSTMGWGGSRGGIADASQADSASMYEARPTVPEDLAARCIDWGRWLPKGPLGLAVLGSAGGLGASGSPPTASGTRNGLGLSIHDVRRL